MNIVLKLCFRMLQQVFHMAIPVLPYQKPVVLTSVSEIVPLLTEKNISSVLLVTDQGLRQNGCTAELENQLRNNVIAATVYDQTQANPTVYNAEEAKRIYRFTGTCSQQIYSGNLSDEQTDGNTDQYSTNQ